MQRIKIVVDSSSDIPDQQLMRYDIEMVGIPITVDGKEYVERKSFATRAFYSVLEKAAELPVTSRVPISDFVNAYAKAWKEGYTDVVVVTMNAAGSGTYESARMAAALFFSDEPQASGSFSVHMVDSRTYSMAYGYPAVRAALMAGQGQAVEEILAYLHDFFSRAEIYLVCYNLEYARRSGRITAAAAVVGDALGLRPIISMIDGETKIIHKARGDRNATKKLADICLQRREAADSPIITVSAAVDAYGEDLVSHLEGKTEQKIPHYKVGAAVTINAGPRMAALCVLGPKRERRRQQRGTDVAMPVYKG